MTAFTPKGAHPGRGAVRKLRMILIFPGGLVCLEKLQQLPSLNLSLCGFDKKRASASWTDQSIDLPDQCFRQNDVCAL